jgi:hypothetical protein
MMSIGYFIEKERRPSEAEMIATLGESCALWERLTRFIQDTYPIPGELSFGGKKYGWNLWYRKSGKTLASLYPRQDGFTVQIVLGRDQVEQVARLDLGANVRRVFETTPQLHDGRWLFIPVEGARDVEDIEQILLVKRKPARKGAA